MFVHIFFSTTSWLRCITSINNANSIIIVSIYVGWLIIKGEQLTTIKISCWPQRCSLMMLLGFSLFVYAHVVLFVARQREAEGYREEDEELSGWLPIENI